MDGLTWRPAGTPDVADIADILADVARATPVGIDASATDVRARLSRPRLDADLDTRLAVDAAGRPVAYAEAADMGVGQDTFRVRLTSAVRPGALLPDQQTWPQHAVGLARSCPTRRSWPSPATTPTSGPASATPASRSAATTPARCASTRPWDSPTPGAASH